MIARKPGLLTAAAVAHGLVVSPVVSSAAAPRAAGQVAHTDAVQVAQTVKKTPAKKAPPKKATYKKPTTKKPAA